MKRWFSIAELRAAKVPEYLLAHLQLVHPNLSRIEGRKCILPDAETPLAEFHIRLFSRKHRRRLFLLYRSEMDRQ